MRSRSIGTDFEKGRSGQSEEFLTNALDHRNFQYKGLPAVV